MNVIDKYIEQLEYSKVSVVDNNYFFPQRFCLFRGESIKWDYPATSTLSRDGINDHDKEIAHYKKRFSEIFPMSTPFKSDLNLRFIAFLQHHAFKTRLIDATHSPNIALYFACNNSKHPEHLREDGYIYKFFGLDIQTIAYDTDQADIDSLFYNPNFPPANHPLLSEPNPFLFYRDTNLYNIKARRQDGWFIIETTNYQADRKNNQSYVKIGAGDKHKILAELKATYCIDDDYIKADLSNIL